MAELTAARNNALPYPVYGTAFVVTFPLLDADGDPVSPSSPDSEVSKNGDTFADCTNEAVEIATSSGICYLILTATEMTADIVTVRIQSTGAKTTVLTLYPRKLAVLSSGTCQGSNDTGDIQLAAADSAVDDTYNGCLCVATIDTVVEARIINDYVGSTKVGEVSPAWVTAQPDSGDTYIIYMPEGRSLVSANTIYISGNTPSTDAAIADAIWDEALAGHAAAGSTGEALSDAGAAGDPWDVAVPGSYGSGTAGKILGDNLNATVSSRASQTSVDTIDDLVDTEVAAVLTAVDTEIASILSAVDTEVAAIKVQTDKLTFTVANVLDANVQRINDVAITGDGSATPFGV